jgi:DNA replication protein DnaC
MLVDQQWLWKENRALARRLQSARLKERGVIEDIDYQHPRGLDRKLLRTLSGSEWVRQNHNVLFIGPTGIGKSWLACALAQKACRDGFSVLHKRATELFRELAVSHVDGSIGRMLLKLSRVDVLVLDDFAMAPLKDSERRDFLEICDDRYQRRSIILTSQMPSHTGTSRSAIPGSQTAFLPGSSTMRFESNSVVNPCAKSEAANQMKRNPERVSPGLLGPTPHPRSKPNPVDGCE